MAARTSDARYGAPVCSGEIRWIISGSGSGWDAGSNSIVATGRPSKVSVAGNSFPQSTKASANTIGEHLLGGARTFPNNSAPAATIWVVSVSYTHLTLP